MEPLFCSGNGKSSLSPAKNAVQFAPMFNSIKETGTLRIYRKEFEESDDRANKKKKIKKKLAQKADKSLKPSWPNGTPRPNSARSTKPSESRRTVGPKPNNHAEQRDKTSSSVTSRALTVFGDLDGAQSAESVMLTKSKQAARIRGCTEQQRVR